MSAQADMLARATEKRNASVATCMTFDGFVEVGSEGICTVGLYCTPRENVVFNMYVQES